MVLFERNEEMTRSALLAVLIAGSACARPSAPAPPAARAAAVTTTPADELLAAIETSDLPRAFTAMCAAYAAGGTPCAETVYLTKLDPNDVMSRIDENQNVKMAPMPAPGAGLAYWDNWSKILSGGAWRARDLFESDDDARRVANMLLVTEVAHELGHHIAQLHRCHPWGPAKELRADELSLSLLRGLLANARLAALHARMRRVADAMIEAVPSAARVEVPRHVDVRAWVAAQRELPSSIPSYASLHLSRQRRLLEEREPYATVAQRLCTGPFAQYLASRRVRPGETRTVALLPNLVLDVIAIDRAGHVFATSAFVEKRKLRIRRVDAVAPELEVDAPADVELVSTFAAFSGDRFAIVNDAHAWVVARGSDGRLAMERRGEVADRSELAFDARGELLAAHRTDTTWDVGPVGAPPTWSVPLQTNEQGGWADGPLERARAAPEKPAIGDGRVVFFDHERYAIRAAGAGEVVTLAGSTAGRHDGSAGDARFFEVAAIAVLADGRIAVVETDHATHGAVLRLVDSR
jgi:hypothetical protein